VITGIVGNIISGQVIGDTAKTLSENFGKIMQDRTSRSINSSDISTTQSTPLDIEYVYLAIKQEVSLIIKKQLPVLDDVRNSEGNL